MAGAIRLVSIERGHDPGEYALLPFGGGGALHVGALIREVGLKAALVPRFPGVTSALGCVMADVRHDQVRTVNRGLEGLDPAPLAALLAEEGTAARAVVERAGLPVERIETRFALDMHYVGQTHSISVPLPEDAPERLSEAMIAEAFDAAYAREFSRLLPGLPRRIVSLRTAAIGRRPALDLTLLAPGAEASLERAERGTRRVWFDGAWREARVLARLELPVGAVIAGPAILEQPDATIVVDPGLEARVDALGNLVIERA
jgi:N-methylhydantoinase A